MQKIKRIVRNAALYVSALIVATGIPLTTFAEDASQEPPETYTYNAETGRWDSSKWRYDAATNTYVPVTTPQPVPPPQPEPSSDTVQSEEAPAEDTAQASAQAASTNNEVDNSKTISSESNTNSNHTVNNTINSDATSGNASVGSNNTAGNAGTGDASADATVINSVHSTIGGETTGVAHFTTDIYGDVYGDITLGPNLNGAPTVVNSTNVDSTTNVNTKNELNNNVNLNATSGDADVTNNTNAGNATTGSATAMANIFNLINTIIGANKSFVGTINIHGNLNGDILISPEFIPQLIASNADSATTIDMPLSTNINDDQSIVNNVNLNATTGEATVEGNTNAGSATSGTAQTKLTILNLTGHEVVAENCILVFVNVKGKWVGMIVDAPGATSAAIGSGVTKNTVSNSGTLNANNKSQITNNINLAAQSGDASVKGNTNAGDARSGDASAIANIANISSSVFNLTGWFAILTINIDGDWYGDFGMDTQYGNVVPLTGVAAAPSGPAAPSAPNLRFGFVPHAPTGDTSTALMQATGGGMPDNASNLPEQVQAVLAAAKAHPKVQDVMSPIATAKKVVTDPLAIFMMVSGGLIAFAPLGLSLFRRRGTLLATLRPRV